MQVDASAAVNDSVEFMPGLLSIIISSWVAEFYWKRKTDQEQIAKTREQLFYYFNHIAKTVLRQAKHLRGVQRG